VTGSPFPAVDAPRRLYANNQLGRVIFDSFGELELGPYSLDGADIERLRAAVASYDQATGLHLKAVEWIPPSSSAAERDPSR
jgi:hypothetical protein